MILLYVIFFFLILRFTVTLFNFISNPKLTSTARHYNDLVSILIPASAAEDKILPLLRSIREQDYNNYEVIIGNKEILTNLNESDRKKIGRDPRFKPAEIFNAPSASTEHYISPLSAVAKGSYIMVPNAGTVIHNGLINNAIHRMKIQNLALLELYANQIMLSPGERLVIPLINYLLLSLVPLRLIRLFRSAAFAISCGQFRLFEAQSYHENNWHTLATETNLMRVIKSYGYNAEVLLANGFLETRMYTGLKDAIPRLSHTIIAGFGSLGALLVYVFMILAGPAVMAVFPDIELLSFAVTLVILIRIMTSLATGENAWLNVLLHPFQMVILVMICLVAVYNNFTGSVTRKQRNMGY